MNDKELIERLRYCGADCDMEICGRCPDYEKANCMEELLMAAADRISDLLTELRDERHRHDRYVDFELDQAEELRKLKEQTRWIPVTERLPETSTEQGEDISYEISGYVLGIDEKNEVQKVKWECGDYFQGWQDEPGTVYNITHWKPLPAPPEESA